MSKKHIAFIYEGEKTERQLIEKMCNIYFQSEGDTSIISFPAAGNIYMLWNRLKEDDFETDMIDVVREMSPEAKHILQDIPTSDFSEIYLFFDYDAHNDNMPLIYRNIDIIKSMLETFDNETELGKLYISYPMIESLRELSSSTEDYSTFYVPVNNEINYKEYVSEQLEFQNFSHITREMWEVACRASVKRANMIVQLQDQIPGYDDFIEHLGQRQIYLAQLKNFVDIGKMVAVLNSLPLFLLEYFDINFWNQIMTKKIV